MFKSKDEMKQKVEDEKIERQDREVFREFLFGSWTKSYNMGWTDAKQEILRRRLNKRGFFDLTIKEAIQMYDKDIIGMLHYMSKLSDKTKVHFIDLIGSIIENDEMHLVESTDMMEFLSELNTDEEREMEIISPFAPIEQIDRE